MQVKTKKLPTLDDLFEWDGHYLIAPNESTWQPGLFQARRQIDGDQVLIKSWQKTETTIDTDLKDLWRREILHKDRLKARPGADELIVPITETSETQDAFYAVMPGEWMPLSVKLLNCGPKHWLRNLEILENRQFLWRNIRRLFDALKLIHDQQVVYGGLNENSVYTASDHEVDFRIGGFEWCAHINDTSGPKTNFAFSPKDDYVSIGNVVTSLLKWSKYEDYNSQIDSFLPSNFSPGEYKFYRALTNPIEHGYFDQRRLNELLINVEKDFIVKGWGEPGKYLLGIQLDGSELPKAIKNATDHQINLWDRQGQISFIKTDLSVAAEIIVYSQDKVKILGQSLAYNLVPDGPVDQKWKAAKVKEAQPRERLPFRNIEPRRLPSGAIEIVQLSEMSKQKRRLGSLANDWTSLIGNGTEGCEADANIRLAMLLTDVILTVNSAVSAIPVKIVKRDIDKVLLIASEIDGFKDLRSKLHIKEPAKNLHNIFVLEQDEKDCEWTLLSSAAIGTRNKEPIAITFDKVVNETGQRFYQFSVVGKVPEDDYLFLSKLTESNPYSVAKRRAKLLSVLGSHKELLNTLDSPEVSLDKGERQPLIQDKEFHEMDPSKQSALQTIWRKTPMQAIVGPPGVGKTHLLSDYTRRLLEENPDSRILVTAQGHQALDNAGQKLNKMVENLPNNKELMVVRTRSDNPHANKELFSSTHARHLLERVKKSALIQKAPTEQKVAIEKLLELSKSTKNNSNVKINKDLESKLRSFESTIMQAATVLLSTTNSSELTRLVESGVQFDEVIIEEAAKATGPELLAPLLLSMHRLLIGDHNQLPAFDSEQLLGILDDPDSVATILENSMGLAGSLFRDHGLEELVEVSGDEDRLALICHKARYLIRLFESFVLNDAQKNELYPGAERLSFELTEQRRMHPIICEVVSSVFYKDRLVTSSQAQEEFKKNKFPIIHLSGHIPDAPIVWVDLPYLQKMKGAKELTPRYHNPTERSVVLSIIEQMRPLATDKSTSMAILSPYRQQALRISQEIRDNAKSLKHLDYFDTATTSGAWAGTVDAFQGSEADVVIVSLVRNNSNFGRHALGFVSDPKRMGVLLSRAKRQLILVGSYDFFKVQARRYSGNHNELTGAGCIPDLIDKLDGLNKKDGPSTPPKFVIVPSSTLIGG